MRIVQVSDLYAPVIGGAEMHVATLAGELAERHEVAVVTLGHSGLPPIEHDGNVTVHRFGGWTNALRHFYVDPKHRFHPTVPDPGFAGELGRVVRETRADVVHCHGWSLYSALRQAPRMAARVVVTLHDFSLVCPRKTFIHRGAVCAGPQYLKCLRCSSEVYGRGKGTALTTGLWASSHMHHRIDRCIAVSEAVAQTARTAFPDERVVVIPSFIKDASSTARNGHRPAFLPPDDGYLLFVGALGPHKGLDVLLQAYASMETEVPLVLIGTARHDTPKSLPRGVVVSLDVAHSEVMAAWGRASVAVVPSTCSEGFGLVAVEAMASGIPVVASDIGGLRDIVRHRETGLLVPAGDPESLRNALVELLADPGLRGALGTAGRERARTFSAREVVPRIESVYEEVVEEARRH
jgi:glycosyltransferase involved in cell wall biosynthesis